MLLTHDQPGEKRTKEYVQAELTAQLREAMSGFANHVTDKQTATGVKDASTTGYWIEILIEKARQMRQEHPDAEPEAIADELQQWFDSQPGLKMNPLLFVPGVWCD
jgi:hypothetical protein